MFRVLLTIYISVVAAFGPALCCCSVEHLLGKGVGDRCCVVNSTPDDHHHGHSHHGDASHHHHGSKASVEKAANNLPEEPGVSNVHRCKCETVSRELSISPKSGETNSDLKFQLVDLSATPASSGHFVLSFSPDTRCQSDQAPTLLTGREILRAYQILVI